MVGSTSSFGVGNYDVFLLRVDAQDKQRWQKNYGEVYNDYGKTIHALPNGSFEIRGTQQDCEDHADINREPCLIACVRVDIWACPQCH
ncbi:MAG: hypothetical protein AAFQ98_23035 [Bacteroidota bacterium]